ncbi:GNAT family N-acetyltransferase [Aliikangiella coralliicola]|uniref:GNAT family N-acetyltransferase n=1 Tax=Aliikangiella coralliicola TaxID=2592383 RepID=A0A545UA77_9GAMM|nr:GNAT family N-acetyltransferase [Aliikangiella coralliicola]TQV86377.1 GNAT family N-acetyltransferase [Aliikangiella coralliicola]
MNYRNANYNDIDAIAELHAESWREIYRGILSDSFLNKEVLSERRQAWEEILGKPLDNQLVFLVESKSSLCGFICASGAKHPQLGTLIDNLHINRNYKGQGLGTRLLSTVAQWSLKNFPKAGLYLEVLEENHLARSFYESLGATNVSENYWHSPCNTKVKEFLYAWKSPAQLTGNQ